MTNLAQHPLSCAFPSMPADDFDALCADIKTNGLIQPIVLFESMVIDGWHRYQACLAAGIEPRSSLLPKGSDPVAFVLACNLHRRHLTASQRALAVVTCSKWRPTGRPAEKAAPGAAFSTAAMAKEADVSERTIRQAKAVAAKGVAVEAVKAGKVSVKTASAKPAKPSAKKVTKKAPEAPAPKPDDFAIENLQGAFDAVQAENDELKQRLAVESMQVTEEDKTLANDLITELRKQVASLSAELKGVKAMRDSLLVENGALKRQCESLVRKTRALAA